MPGPQLSSTVRWPRQPHPGHQPMPSERSVISQVCRRQSALISSARFAHASQGSNGSYRSRDSLQSSAGCSCSVASRMRWKARGGISSHSARALFCWDSVLPSVWRLLSVCSFPARYCDVRCFITFIHRPAFGAAIPCGVYNAIPQPLIVLNVASPLLSAAGTNT